MKKVLRERLNVGDRQLEKDSYFDWVAFIDLLAQPNSKTDLMFWYELSQYFRSPAF